MFIHYLALRHSATAKGSPILRPTFKTDQRKPTFEPTFEPDIQPDPNTSVSREITQFQPQVELSRVSYN